MARSTVLPLPPPLQLLPGVGVLLKELQEGSVWPRKLPGGDKFDLSRSTSAYREIDIELGGGDEANVGTWEEFIKEDPPNISPGSEGGEDPLSRPRRSRSSKSPPGEREATAAGTLLCCSSCLCFNSQLCCCFCWVAK